MKKLALLFLLLSFVYAVFGFVNIFRDDSLSFIPLPELIQSTQEYVRSVPAEIIRAFLPVVNDRRLRILIVPGHDKNTPGTAFGSAEEEQMNAELGEKLYAYLSKDSRFEPFITRTQDGYTTEFAEYFKNQGEAIDSFISEKCEEIDEKISRGEIMLSEGVYHRAAPAGMIRKLYGINQWVNEKDIDIVIHVHFNDYPRKNRNAKGILHGFTVYIPDEQFSNSEASRDVAKKVFPFLNRFYTKSNQNIESQGIVPDQELIAIGACNTVDTAATALFEYGYIYEPQFTSPDVRHVVIEEFAYSTYRGLDQYASEVGEGEAMVSVRTLPFDTTYLPFNFFQDLEKGTTYKKDTLALQSALVFEKVFPAEGYEPGLCQVSGVFGACTEDAVRAFQNKYGIVGEEGRVGELTREKLNEIYSR